ncbi:MAG TPA: STAS domain-containing protein [Solirubrobacteraceae bacterium]|jgi:anti-sigma B factor antagonist|nr:STAS domain-containing protein [Solirubrobacteraceae bacterium]
MASSARPDFHLDAIENGPVTVLRPSGELDLVHGSRLTAALEPALARRPATLAIDLRQLSFMDSSGIHAIIAAELRCRLQGTRFYLIRGSATIDRLMAVCGLDRAFPTVSGPEQLPAGDDTPLRIAV